MRVSEEKCRSTNDVVDCVYLIHDDEIRIIVVVLDCIYETFEKRITHLVMSTLFQLEVLDSAAEFEEIFDDVLLFATVFARIRLNHELVAMLS